MNADLNDPSTPFESSCPAVVAAAIETDSRQANVLVVLRLCAGDCRIHQVGGQGVRGTTETSVRQDVPVHDGREREPA